MRNTGRSAVFPSQGTIVPGHGLRQRMQTLNERRQPHRVLEEVTLMTAPSTASWRKLAACQGIDPEVFYPASDEDDAVGSQGDLHRVPGTPGLPRACPGPPRAKGSGAAPRSGSVVGSTGSVASRPDRGSAGTNPGRIPFAPCKVASPPVWTVLGLTLHGPHPPARPARLGRSPRHGGPDVGTAAAHRGAADLYRDVGGRCQCRGRGRGRRGLCAQRLGRSRTGPRQPRPGRARPHRDRLCGFDPRLPRAAGRDRRSQPCPPRRLRRRRAAHPVGHRRGRPAPRRCRRDRSHVAVRPD